MTNRERMLAVINRYPTDRVPVCPDLSNMVPCRLTGKPFWDMYLFQDPPMWQVYRTFLCQNSRFLSKI